MCVFVWVFGHVYVCVSVCMCLSGCQCACICVYVYIVRTHIQKEKKRRLCEYVCVCVYVYVYVCFLKCFEYQSLQRILSEDDIYLKENIEMNLSFKELSFFYGSVQYLEINVINFHNSFFKDILSVVVT